MTQSSPVAAARLSSINVCDLVCEPKKHMFLAEFSYDYDFYAHDLRLLDLGFVNYEGNLHVVISCVTCNEFRPETPEYLMLHALCTPQGLMPHADPDQPSQMHLLPVIASDLFFDLIVSISLN